MRYFSSNDVAGKAAFEELVQSMLTFVAAGVRLHEEFVRGIINGVCIDSSLSFTHKHS
jgi:hypothetical protein